MSIPIANFTTNFGNHPIGRSPFTVDFIDTSTGAPTSWEWDFGDGSPHDFTQNPIHIYTIIGYHTVVLIVSNIDGSDTIHNIDCVLVESPIPPGADFSALPTSGSATLAVTFYDSSHFYGGVGTRSWDWDFGDGSPHDFTQNPIHEYVTPGLYSVSLTVADDEGSDTLSRPDYINVFTPTTTTPAPVTTTHAPVTTTHAPVTTITFNDCLLGSLSNISHANLHNCSFSIPPIDSTLVNCQSGWSQPPVPTWDGPRAGFNNFILAAGVLSGSGNPEPGVGYPSYPGYPTGLWGTLRTGIGAVDFVSAIFNDCLLGSASNVNSSIFNNCALSLIPTYSTLVHCQTGWIQPPVPTWYGDRALFNDFILAEGVVYPPEPGIGYPSYTGYPTGLWGTPRIGIGAVDFLGATTTSAPTVSYTSSTSVSAIQNQVKLSGAMTCIGWIKSISVNDGDSLIPLAISDPYGNVLNTDAALRFEILRQGRDYRLQYSGSKTKPIDKNLKIKIDDGNWHMLSYESDANGNMTYSVDGLLLPTEDGIDQYGLPYSVAKSLSNRVGGGTVWSPFLYKARQIIYMYNWRFGKNFNLGLKWIKELMNIDKSSLGIF